MKTYSIIRFYSNPSKPNETMKKGLTLEEAKEHCSDPDTREPGVYFDGYTEE